MNEHDDGGPAFPVSPDEARGKVSSVHGGMSLLDYFAGQALAGMLAERGSGIMDFTADDIHQQSKTRASWAYSFAAAMLAERKRRMGDE